MSDLSPAMLSLEARLLAKIASLERDLESGMYQRPDSAFSLPEPHQDFDPRWDGASLYVRAGLRCIEGGEWVSVGEKSLSTTTGTYWMKWTNTTDALPGKWSDGIGSPPEQDDTCSVFPLWTITEVDGVNQVEYHRRGSIKAIDWKDC